MTSCSSSAFHTNAAMSVKPMRSSRKSFTAISSAPHSAAGYVPPFSPAALANLRQGKRSILGGSKSRLDIVFQSNCGSRFVLFRFD